MVKGNSRVPLKDHLTPKSLSGQNTKVKIHTDLKRLEHHTLCSAFCFFIPPTQRLILLTLFTLITYITETVLGFI